jgi:peptide/nickel transport system permease protein
MPCSIRASGSVDVTSLTDSQAADAAASPFEDGAEVPRPRRLRVPRSFPWITVLVIAALFAAAVLGDLIAPHDMYEPNLMRRLQPPVWMEGGSWSYVLGADALGRDILSRLIGGARTSLTVALVGLIIGGGGGATLGIIGGYFGGRTDAVIMRVADATLAFPMILFAILLAMAMGSGLLTVVVAISLVLWARFARVIRSDVLVIREMDYVRMAIVAGASPWWILRRHILPNVANTLIVLAGLQVGWVITLEATLSFIGAGISPPTPAWGSMTADGREYIVTNWWVSFMPGAAIVVAVVAFTRLGDWLRDWLDPRLALD